MTGRVDLIIAEDVGDEVAGVLQHRFRDHPAISEAIEWHYRLLASFDLVLRTTYEAAGRNLESRVRDPKDVPVLACAIASRADFLVSGDEDLLVLGTAEGTPIRRTRDVLAMLEQVR